MKFLDKLNNVLDKLYTNQESMIYFYIALGALAAILILLIIITSIRIKKTQKKINKSDEVVVETGTPKTEETTEVKKEEPVVAEPVITEVPTTEPIKEEIKEEEPAYKSEVTIKQEETPTEVQTENTVEPVIEPVIEPVVETVKEEPVVPVTEELPEIELPKITETSEDEISKLINSNEEPEVITDAPISDLPIEEPKPEEPKLEQTQTLDDLRNRLNNIRHK